MKEIYFTKHALKQLEDRKAKEDEVRETVESSKWETEREGRMSAFFSQRKVDNENIL